MLEPTDESEMLDPTVERWSDESTDEDDIAVERGLADGWACPARGADGKSCRAELPDVRTVFRGHPNILAREPFGSDCRCPFSEFFRYSGLRPARRRYCSSVFGPVESFGARMSLSIDPSISRIACVSRPEFSKSPESRLLVEMLMRSSVARSFLRSARALATVGIISPSMIPREAIE